LPFRSTDTATSRARIGAIVDGVRGQRVAIVGGTGTGPSILDAVAKMPVAEIHLSEAVENPELRLCVIHSVS